MPGTEQTSEQLALAVVDRGEQAIDRARAVARQVKARVHRVLRGEAPRTHRPDVQPSRLATQDTPSL
jgi:hypothetical protein